MTVWTDHVKRFAKINQISYGCAISDQRCKASYKNVVPKQAARSAMTKSAAKAGRDLIKKKENKQPEVVSFRIKKKK